MRQAGPLGMLSLSYVEVPTPFVTSPKFDFEKFVFGLFSFFKKWFKGRAFVISRGGG